MFVLKTLQLGLILLPALSFGQLSIPRDVLLKTYDRQTIIFLSTGVMQDGQLQKRTLFSNPLKEAVKNDPMAYSVFKKSNLQLFGGGFLAGMGFMPMSLGVFNLKGNNIFTQTEATSLALGGALAVGLGIWMGNKGTNGFHESTWLYNRNAILRGLDRFMDSTNQAQVIRSYEQNTIRRTQFGFYQNGRYEVRDGLGFYDPLKNRLRPNVMAYSVYQRGSLYRKVGNVFGYASILGSMHSITRITNSNRLTTKTIQESVTVMLVSSAFAFLSSSLIVYGENEIQKAVWFYNRDAFVNGVF